MVAFMASAVKNKILDESSYNVYLTKHTLLALRYVLSLSLSLSLSPSLWHQCPRSQLVYPIS